VTLPGDPAHLIAPSGEGANLAMYDGAELGKAIAAQRGGVEGALAEYEEAMFVRSGKEAVDAARILRLCLGEDAPHGSSRGDQNRNEPRDAREECLVYARAAMASAKRGNLGLKPRSSRIGGHRESRRKRALGVRAVGRECHHGREQRGEAGGIVADHVVCAMQR
jgi:hypothetical protein